MVARPTMPPNAVLISTRADVLIVVPVTVATLTTSGFVVFRPAYVVASVIAAALFPPVHDSTLAPASAPASTAFWSWARVA